jgi:2-polyprenyl-6-hydroxyphenyl methylase/3-demethylubiquinone-9 3-methyltransferase
VAARAEDYESNQTFDIVFCINVINHVEDLSKAMHNLRNLCKSGGTLVISVDEHRHHLPHRIFRWLPLDILHPHQLLKNEFKSLLRSNGFELTFDTILKTGHIFQYRLWVAHLQHKPL